MELKNEVLRYLGYNGQEIDSALKGCMEKHIRFVNEKIKPKFLYRIFDVEVNDKVYLKNTNVSFSGSDIINHLKGAYKCVVMVASLGLESERVLTYLSKTDVSSAVIFDAVCTAKIEEICDCCESEIKKWAEDNSSFINFRYSPGYGNFSLEYQRQIVNLLSAETAIGLNVTESSLLIPQKSVTAVIGIFKTEQIKYKNCEGCNLKNNCMFRKNEMVCTRE